MMKSSQTTLKRIVLEILEEGPMTIKEINEIVFTEYLEDLEAHDIVWTYQHLIASSRKTLVDDGAIDRLKGGVYCLRHG